jgi:hypothetical protein
MQRLLDTSGYFAEDMRVEELKSGKYTVVDPITRDWAALVRKDLGIHESLEEWLMDYENLMSRIEEEAASGPGSGVSAPGSEGATTEDNVAYLPSQLGVVKPRRGKRKKKKRQVEEAPEDAMTKLRQDLKPAIIKLFEGDPFHLVETDARLWTSRFGVDKYLTADAPLVSVENRVRGIQNLSGTLLQSYGNDRGYLEMVIDAMNEREPLNSFNGFKENDYLYGTRIRSNHEGVEMVFEAALDPLYAVSETVYIEDEEVLDRWEELASGIKRVNNIVYPQGERFTPGSIQQLEYAIIDAIDAEDEAEEELE